MRCTLILESVSLHFSGNFSCIGSTSAGGSAMSDPLFLDVHYPPGEAQLTSSPESVYKEGPLSLHCILPDPGHPPASQFIWLKGGTEVLDKTNQTWTLEKVGLTTRTNISCQGVNIAGPGAVGTKKIGMDHNDDFSCAEP